MKECVLVLAGGRVTVVSDFGKRVRVRVSVGVFIKQVYTALVV